jgi:uncharacterized protein
MIELSPVGVKCNLNCPYCYEIPMRDAGNLSAPFDLDIVMNSLEQKNQEFILFGGEPLLLPIEYVEKLWKYGFEKHGKNGIQTNGTLFTEEHYELIRKYKVHVGISLDGPAELNDTRWAGNFSLTREKTDKTLEAIRRLCELKLYPSLIITLHRRNATPELLPILQKWIKDMEAIGVRSARLHTLEIEYESVADSLALSPERNAEVLLEMARFEAEELKTLSFDIFTDIKKMMQVTSNQTTCIWNACDPYTTRAVQGMDGQGVMTNCGRSNKEGINFKKSDTEGYERYLSLYNTPEEYKGCKDCRFWLMCKGQCPGTSEQTDWRNRTDLCGTWKQIFTHFEDKFEQEGIVPLSKSPLRKQVEEKFIKYWQNGKNPHLFDVYKEVEDQEIKANNPILRQNVYHGDYTRKEELL